MSKAAILTVYKRHLKLGNQLVALLDPSNGIVDQLVDDGLGGLLLVDHGGGLAHQVGTGVVNVLVINVIGQVLHVVLNGDDTLGSELLDLVGAVLFPVLDVGVVADTERTALRWILVFVIIKGTDTGGMEVLP